MGTIRNFIAAAAVMLAASTALAGPQRARIDFSVAGGYTSGNSVGAACGATDNEICYMHFGASAGNPLVVMFDGAETVVGPAETSTGFAWPTDATDDESLEIGFGLVSDANGPCVFTVGTSGAFYAKAKFDLAETDDLDVAMLCFIESATHADVDDPADINTTSPVYTDYACLGVTTSGDFRTYTSVGGATAIDTNITTTTLADGTDVTVMLKSSSAGAVTYFVDGTNQATSNGAVAYSFTNALVVRPLLLFANAGTGGGNPEMQLLECGLQ